MGDSARKPAPKRHADPGPCNCNWLIAAGLLIGEFTHLLDGGLQPLDDFLFLSRAHRAYKNTLTQTGMAGVSG